MAGPAATSPTAPSARYVHLIRCHLSGPLSPLAPLGDALGEDQVQSSDLPLDERAADHVPVGFAMPSQPRVGISGPGGRTVRTQVRQAMVVPLVGTHAFVVTRRQSRRPSAACSGNETDFAEKSLCHAGCRQARREADPTARETGGSHLFRLPSAQ